MRRIFAGTVLFLLSIVFFGVVVAPAAQASQPILVTQSIDESKLVTLRGNTRPEASAKNDHGRVPDGFVIEHMLLQLQRSPQQERELEGLIGELTDKSSPNFHRWLTPQEFGARFGVAAQDRETIKNWLASHNLKVNVDYTNGILIDFSGTAGSVRAAFHTEIHQLDVKGVKHYANMSDPKIPAALAQAVAGVVSMHDFKPHTMHKMKTNYTEGGGYFALVPGDLETIYNFNPLFTAGNSGQGQTIVVLEDTNVYSTADWTTFRSTFGLSGYTAGTFTQTHPAPPSGTNNCSNPGVNGDDGEAILDAEYASAAAPSAAIVLASCTDTSSFGGLIALQNILNGSAPQPETVSMSYGECEVANGATSNAAFNSAYQQAVSEGVTMFVSAGDEGAASCNADEANATYGIGISGLASSQYTVAVGGTDYGDTYANTTSTYWNSTNTSTYESAKSYINEIPWNDSCASVLIATASGYGTTYGSSGFCNSSEGEDDFLTTASGSGGPSGCATGSYSVGGVVSGTCAGWPKPSFQSVVGNPSDSVRDIPDVSLFAANGVWGHYYVFCYSDPEGGTPCTGSPANWSGAGGTSFASPIWAGIQALVDQKQAGRQGAVNGVYYSLADTEYGASGDSSCNSTLGNGVSSSCIFYDVTQGDMDLNCTGSYNCYLPSGSYGVLSTSNSAYDKAYGTTTGWDFATGIGTVNVNNLVKGWPSSGKTSTSTGVTSNLNPSTSGQAVTFTATVAPTPNGGTVTFTYSSTTLCSAVPLTSGIATCAYSSLPVGSDTVTATYSGNSSYDSSSGTVSQKVNAASGGTVTLSVSALSFANEVVSGTSAAKAVTLKNTGSTSVSITSIAVTPNTNFTITSNTCGSTVAANKSCVVKPAFHPTTLGALTASLAFTDSASGSPQSVSLSGTGTADSKLMPVSASYAAEVEGKTSAAKTFTLTNNEAATLTGISISTTGDFAVSSKTCGTTLAAKSKCTISVTFTPEATGTLTGQLNVNSSGDPSALSSSLKGTGKE